MAAKDPYRYFRVEARELLQELTRGALELDRGQATAELIGSLLRLAHTLKGAARVVKQLEISELAHTMEEILAPYRSGEAPLPHDRISQFLWLVDAVEVLVKSLDAPRQEGQEPHGGQGAEEFFNSVRVDITDMDGLLHGISEARVHLAALRREARAIDHAFGLYGEAASRPPAQVHEAERDPGTRDEGVELRLLRQSYRKFQALVERSGREIERVQRRASELRLLPASAIFATLQRSARDVAEALRKQVKFEATGGEIRLDTHVLRPMKDALLHVVRNAVGHGIELESERLAIGKPATGLVRLKVERRGHRITFVLSDDGRGIDLDAIRRAAVVGGLVPEREAQALGPEAAFGLLLRGGFTTMPSADEVSGRGVGLDVVRETVARLKGEVRLHSEKGKGTSIEICVPVSLEALVVLTVEAPGMTVSIPLDAVQRTLRLDEKEIAHSASGLSIVHDQKEIPFVPLAGIFQRSPPPCRAPRACSALVIQAGHLQVAVGVELLLEIREVIMRPLPPLLRGLRLVAGAFLDEEGSPQPILDPTGLAEATVSGAGVTAKTAVPRQLPILVIDDSLTTRMLEQSILESAGYDVRLATSGEDGLSKARDQRCGLFLVDVEMPGMNGFEFIERANADPTLRGIPSILVTSRASAEDRCRGEEAGAKAYIVKSEFDEGRFLRTIRELLG